MIFLSAQPATPYFIWQLEVQLTNFKRLNIKKEQIHVLFSFEKKNGIHFKVADLMEKYSTVANFFVYEDTRLYKEYLSTIRPHIIRKHFLAHKELEQENIFYHDSDIVFTEKLPDFERLNQDETWYFSDTRLYMDSKHIKSLSVTAFRDMCRVMKISPKMVTDNDENTGGAQALLKKVDHFFWGKLEEDCEMLFKLLSENREKYAKIFSKKTGKPAFQFHPVSPWCSDMWVLFWNAIKIAKVKIDPTLDFCWPHDRIKLWNDVNIYHDAGVDSTMDYKYFYKGFFTNREPYDDDFSFVAKEKCGSKYVNLLGEHRKRKKYLANDTTFLITARADVENIAENIRTCIRYLTQHFETNISLIEADSLQRLHIDGVDYTFIEDRSLFFDRQKYVNRLARQSTTPIIVMYDAETIVPPHQMYNSILSIRYSASQISYPFDNAIEVADGVLKSTFRTLLDIKLFSKFLPASSNSNSYYKGCAVLDRKYFIEMGMDNQALSGNNFGDHELYKRSQILGYVTEMEKGPLYHLGNLKGYDSRIFNNNQLINNYNEFFKISSMKKQELHSYVKTWGLNLGEI